MRWLIIIVLVLAASCGSGAGSSFPSDVPTDLTPVVSRVEPNTGAVGDIITIFGYGYSTSTADNIVIIGAAAVSATGYALVDPPSPTEIETLTATIPEGVETGENSVAVLVYDNVSNQDITFTVTP